MLKDRLLRRSSLYIVLQLHPRVSFASPSFRHLYFKLRSVTSVSVFSAYRTPNGIVMSQLDQFMEVAKACLSSTLSLQLLNSLFASSFRSFSQRGVDPLSRLQSKTSRVQTPCPNPPRCRKSPVVFRMCRHKHNRNQVNMIRDVRKYEHGFCQL